MQGLPQPPGLLSGFDEYLPRNRSAVYIFQVWVPIYVSLVLSTSAASLLLGCQAISLAVQIVRVSLEGLCSPELYVREVLRIQGGWYVFGGGKGIGTQAKVLECSG